MIHHNLFNSISISYLFLNCTYIIYVKYYIFMIRTKKINIYNINIHINVENIK